MRALLLLACLLLALLAVSVRADEAQQSVASADALLEQGELQLSSDVGRLVELLELSAKPAAAKTVGKSARKAGKAGKAAKAGKAGKSKAGKAGKAGKASKAGKAGKASKAKKAGKSSKLTKAQKAARVAALQAKLNSDARKRRDKKRAARDARIQAADAAEAKRLLKMGIKPRPHGRVLAGGPPRVRGFDLRKGTKDGSVLPAYDPFRIWERSEKRNAAKQAKRQAQVDRQTQIETCRQMKERTRRRLAMEAKEQAEERHRLGLEKASARLKAEMAKRDLDDAELLEVGAHAGAEATLDAEMRAELESEAADALAERAEARADSAESLRDLSEMEADLRSGALLEVDDALLLEAASNGADKSATDIDAEIDAELDAEEATEEIFTGARAHRQQTRRSRLGEPSWVKTQRVQQEKKFAAALKRSMQKRAAYLAMGKSLRPSLRVTYGREDLAKEEFDNGGGRAVFARRAHGQDIVRFEKRIQSNGGQAVVNGVTRTPCGKEITDKGLFGAVVRERPGATVEAANPHPPKWVDDSVRSIWKLPVVPQYKQVAEADEYGDMPDA